MSKLVTIFGGSGFVGRYVARRMAQDGWRVRVAVRRPNEALHVKPYGRVGQVEPVFCNIRDDDSVRAVTMGADAVINCVGIMNEVGKNKFKSVQAEGAGRIARIAAEQGVGQVVQISAIGADAESNSIYARTKGQGEAEVLAAYPNAVILRPSVIFGVEDQFFNRFASLSFFGPILPLVGGKTRFQPVYVDDVAAAAVAAAEGKAAPGVYELGGPDVATLDALVKKMLKIIHRRRLVVNKPFFAGTIIATVLDLVQTFTGGLVTNTILTKDQVKNLRIDNVVAPGAKGLADLGVTPTPMDAVLPEYLYRFRPQGQYDDITNSAKNLKA
ncbi:complex I NDUFA9 subunit family protein [Actibacterium sp.]|uniref:complex I NDUFA9 subunit family protein n=1 Tax=Actibacterium sp. TaxID=1872125 RepID=UPI0035679EAC